MSTIAYDVTYEEERNRLTVAFRIILAIPHLIVCSGVGIPRSRSLPWCSGSSSLFTGKRNEGSGNLQQSWLGYYGRVMGTSTSFRRVPGVRDRRRATLPCAAEITYEESANRLTNGLRFLWIIPAVIVAIFIGIGGAVVTLISWFAILFTGKHPRGMWDFVLKAVRYTLQLEAYALLMTDTYPKFGEGAMTASTSTPPTTPSGYVVPPPPPAN